MIDLLGSTFADHIISYFPQDFNVANVSLADDFLTNFYAGTHSSSVFWNPERVTDADTLSEIQSLGFGYTFIDQMRHVRKWFGRNSSLGDDGYRINLVNGVGCFVINDQASTYRFQNTDNGVALSLRDLLHRKARSGTQDQVIVLFSQWEDFTNKANADAYDKNIRWIANRPWLQLVTPDQIASGAVDLSQPPDGMGDTWGSVNRGTSGGLVKVAHDYVDHATEENYDNWYNGLGGREEGLRDKLFDIRPGVQLPAGKEFGTLSLGTGIIAEAWAQVAAVPSGALAALARGTAGAAVFPDGISQSDEQRPQQIQHRCLHLSGCRPIRRSRVSPRSPTPNSATSPFSAGSRHGRSQRAQEPIKGLRRLKRPTWIWTGKGSICSSMTGFSRCSSASAVA